MRAIWIDQVLPGLVPDGVVLQPRGAGQVGGESGRMLELFDRSGRALLILGDPGSGKTVSLLDLTRGLIERAEADPEQAVPVVFKLSSWRSDRSIEQWLVDELAGFYKVPRRQGRRWLQTRRILPLFDGLDEVRGQDQIACIEALNRFMVEGIPGIAVSCRSAAYEAMATPLAVSAALELDQLSTEQVFDYVDRTDVDLSALSSLLRKDDVLLATARTPLMLRMLARAYRGMSAEDLRRDDLTTVEGRQTHVLETYLQKVFEKRDEDGDALPPFDQDEVVSGLAFIACRLQIQSESVLLVDRLQPSWLRGRRRRVAYLATTRLLGGLVLGVLIGILLEIGLALAGGGVTPVVRESVQRLAFGMLIGLSGGVIVVGIDLVRFRRGMFDRRKGSRIVLAAVYLVLFSGLGLAVFTALIGVDAWDFGLISGVFWGALFWAYFGIPSNRRLAGDIRMPEALSFSRRSAVRGAVRGSGAGALVLIGAEALLGLGDAADILVRILSILIAGIAGAGIGGTFGAIIGGLHRGRIRFRAGPREGLRLAFRSSVLTGSFVATGMVLVSLPVFWLGIGGVWGAATGIVGAVFVGLLAALLYGGMDAIRHAVLRMLLHLTEPLPRPMIAFLEYAADLSFLQRAGGGYLFAHNILMGYFATIDDAVSGAANGSGVPEAVGAMSE